MITTQIKLWRLKTSSTITLTQVQFSASCRKFHSIKEQHKKTSANKINKFQELSIDRDVNKVGTYLDSLRQAGCFKLSSEQMIDL